MLKKLRLRQKSGFRVKKTCIEPNILLCSIYTDSVTLLSVLPFSGGLNLLKEVGVSVIFVLVLLEHFTPDLSVVFKLTTRLKSTIPERFISNSKET